MTKPGALPRRANTIRKMAAEMGATLTQRTLRLVLARRAVSDRIGYLVAVLVGAVVLRFTGWIGVSVVLLAYVYGAWRAYRAWKRIG